MQRKYTVTGMTCAHCETSVREEVSGIEGVLDVEVSAETGTLMVKAQGEITDADIIAAVNEAGYTATPA